MDVRDEAGLSIGPSGLPGPELWAKLSWESDLWIFAYGSLMWDPGFPYCDAVPAVRFGHHRSLCVYSRGHRGTPERPGLVLGLDEGGSCQGIAYRVPSIDVPGALAYLWDREMQSSVYRLQELDVQLPEGRIPALAFVVDRGHRDYASGLSRAATARLVHQGVGHRGSARHYLESTILELERLGVVDRPLQQLACDVRSLSRIERRAA